MPANEARSSETCAEVFVRATKAAVEHHFDNREFCGDWCPVKRAEAGSEEAKKAASKRRCKGQRRKLSAIK